MTRSSRLRLVVATGIGAIVAIGVGATAQAHASLLSTNPSADAVLDESPPTISLTFTEGVDPASDSIRLFDADGRPIPVGDVTATGEATLNADVDTTLASGSYVVAWSVVSADSHPIRGAFVFSVGERTESAGQLVNGLDLTDVEQSAGATIAVGRFASYLGLAGLLGVLLAALWIAPDLLRSRRLGITAMASGHVAIAGTITMVCAQAAEIGASALDWSAVASTRAGAWWIARLALLAVLTMLVPWRGALTGRRGGLVCGAVTIGTSIVFAAGGHAVSGRLTTGALTATVVHLAAMVLWVGCVAVIVMSGRAAALVVARRASPIALGAVAALALSGVFNGWRQLGSLSAVTSSSYGRWLIVKLAVIGLVLIVATMSRRIARRADSEALGVDGATIRRPVTVEAIGMVVVLAATAGLTGAIPPQAVGSIAKDVTVSTTQGDVTAMVDLLPARTGGTTMHVYIVQPAGTQSAPVDEITVSASLQQPAIGPLDIAVFRAGDNHVTAPEADFPIAGDWTLTITARFGEFDETEFVVEAPITE